MTGQEAVARDVIAYGEGSDPETIFWALVEGARLRDGSALYAGHDPHTAPSASIADVPGFFLAGNGPMSKAQALVAATDWLREGRVEAGGPFCAFPIVSDLDVERSATTLMIVLEHGDLLIEASAASVVRSRRPDAVEVDVVSDDKTRDIVTVVCPAKITGYAVDRSDRIFADLSEAVEAAMHAAEELPGAVIGVDKVTRGVEGPLVAVSYDVVHREITARAVEHRVRSECRQVGYMFFGTARKVSPPMPRSAVGATWR